MTGRARQARYCSTLCTDRARRSRNHDRDRANARRRYHRARQEAGHQPRTIIETDVSWDFPPGLMEEIRKAAATIRRQYKALDFDDLRGEGLIWAATHPATIAAHLADPAKGLSYTAWAIRSHLAKLSLRELEHRAGNVPMGLNPREAISD